MAFFSGKGASVTIDGFVAPMSEWTLSVEGERIDISHYDSPTFDGIVGLVTASVNLKGPYPYGYTGKGYRLFPDQIVEIVLYLDSAFTYYWKVLARVEKLTVTDIVQGTPIVTIDAVVIENILTGADITERIQV